MKDKEILEKLLKEAESYLDKGLTYDDANVQSWNNSLKIQCERIFGKGSRVCDLFNKRLYSSLYYDPLDERGMFRESVIALNDGLRKTICDLKRLIDDFDYTPKNVEVNSSSKTGKDKQTININVDASNKNTISNNNVNSISIKSYDEVKDEIENNTFLDEDSVKELLEKLEEIKQLENSNDSKAKKWSIGKKILAFILDKGADIAISYIPLILQAISK